MVTTDQAAQSSTNNTQSAYTAQAPYSAKRTILAGELDKAVKSNEQQQITTSVVTYDLTDKKLIYTNNVDFAHFAASTQKIPITELVLQELRAGRITLDTKLTWTDNDVRAGAGVYDQPGAPKAGTVRDVMYDMLNKSSNTAVRVFVNNALGGAVATNQRLASYPQLKVTRLQPLDANRFYVGYTTARESAYIFGVFYSHNDTYAAFAKNALATNVFNDYGPRSQVLDKSKMLVTDKQGMLNDPDGNNRHDIGVIKNKQTGREVLYTMFTTSSGADETRIAPAEQSLKTMGRSILTYNGDTTAQSSPQARSAAPNAAATPDSRILY